MFTVDCAENLGQKGMNYSIVDLNLNSGLGDVTIKNQFLFGPSTEGLAATMNCNRDSIWVVGHEYGSNAFYAFLINENGLNTIPVVSNLGNILFSFYGQMKFSPSNRKLAYMGELFDFSKSSGKITNSIFIGFGGYGLSFSANSEKLFFCMSGNLIGQYDITSLNAIDIVNSYQTIYSGPDNSEYWGLQLSNTGEIYVAATDTSKISKINFPEKIGVAVDFSPYSVDLSGRKSQFTFPSFIENYFNRSPEDDCIEEELVIPNLFSPNGDGVNDLFALNGLEKGDEVVIYNRWGIKIYEFREMNDGWDGRTTSGEKCNEGIYYYCIKRKNTENKKGFIHLFY